MDSIRDSCNVFVKSVPISILVQKNILQFRESKILRSATVSEFPKIVVMCLIKIPGMRSHSRLRCAGRNAAQILTQLFKCKYNYKYSFTSDITNKGSTPFLQAQIQHAPILSPLFQILFHVQQATYYDECTDMTTDG